MANRPISDLPAAEALTVASLLAAENDGEVQKVSGAQFIELMRSLVLGHGGIASFSLTGTTGTDPVINTYTIEYADGYLQTIQIKDGKQGIRGPAGPGPSVSAVSTEYASSTSGTTIPSSWSESVPAVPQGGYLWCKTTVTWSNEGGTSVMYSVARQGVDGTGSVSSVNNVSPDGSGNVSLTPANIGAAPGTGDTHLNNTDGLRVMIDLTDPGKDIRLVDENGNLFAKMGVGYFTGNPEWQLVGQNGVGDIIMDPSTGLRLLNPSAVFGIGTVTLNLAQLTSLLAVISGAGPVKTVNGKTPSSSGAVSLAASDIPGAGATSTLLWEGTWSSGSISVDGISDYSAVLILLSNYETIFASISNYEGAGELPGETYRLYGMGGHATSANSFARAFISATADSGDTVTMGYCLTEAGGSITAGTVVAIFGLIK